jgi:hypothetical protein
MACPRQATRRGAVIPTEDEPEGGEFLGSSEDDGKTAYPTASEPRGDPRLPRRHPVTGFRCPRLLLAEIDALHGSLAEPATRKLCERALLVFGDHRYQRLAYISNGQLHNVRHSVGYQRQRNHLDKTRPSSVNIGDCRPDRHILYSSAWGPETDIASKDVRVCVSLGRVSTGLAAAHGSLSAAHFWPT